MHTRGRGLTRVTTSIIVIIIIAVGAIAAATYYLGTPKSTSSSSSTISSTTTTTSSTPIVIGEGIEETGALSTEGLSMLLSAEIWVNNTNANGGLLGHPVKLVALDDQSNPDNEPAIYEQLITQDHAAFLLSPYATPEAAAALPIAQQYGEIMLGQFPFPVNTANYTKYFNDYPLGENAAGAQLGTFFQMASTLSPRPSTVAFVYVQNSYGVECQSAIKNVTSAYGFNLVYDQGYPSTQTDFTSTMLTIKNLNPDIFFSCSFPTDSVALMQAAKADNFVPKIYAGSNVGFQALSNQESLGPLLNNVVIYDTWTPSLNFTGDAQFFNQYRPLAQARGVDVAGFYGVPNTYAILQVLGQAITATGSLNSTIVAQYMHSHTFNTIVGPITFDANGEWAHPFLVYQQFQDITNSSASTFMSASHLVAVAPSQYANGKLIYPFPGWGVAENSTAIANGS